MASLRVDVQLCRDASFLERHEVINGVLDMHGIVFGYFTAPEKDAGKNLPGQTVFTCLAHDIIAHEMTHALVDGIFRVGWRCIRDGSIWKVCSPKSRRRLNLSPSLILEPATYKRVWRFAPSTHTATQLT